MFLTHGPPSYLPNILICRCSLLQMKSPAPALRYTDPGKCPLADNSSTIVSWAFSDGIHAWPIVHLYKALLISAAEIAANPTSAQQRAFHGLEGETTFGLRQVGEDAQPVSEDRVISQPHHIQSDLPEIANDRPLDY